MGLKLFIKLYADNQLKGELIAQNRISLCELLESELSLASWKTFHGFQPQMFQFPQNLSRKQLAKGFLADAYSSWQSRFQEMYLITTHVRWVKREVKINFKSLRAFVAGMQQATNVAVQKTIFIQLINNLLLHDKRIIISKPQHET